MKCPRSNTPLTNQELRSHVGMRHVIREWCDANRKVLPDAREVCTEVEKRGLKSKISRSSSRNLPRTMSLSSPSVTLPSSPPLPSSSSSTSSSSSPPRPPSISSAGRSLSANGVMMTSARERGESGRREVTSPPTIALGGGAGRATALTRGLSFQEVRMRARSMEELRQMMSRSQSERRSSGGVGGTGAVGSGEGERE